MPHLDIVSTHSQPLDHTCGLVVGYANGAVISNLLDDASAAQLASAIATVCDKPAAGSVTRVAAPWNTKLLVAAVHLQLALLLLLTTANQKILRTQILLLPPKNCVNTLELECGTSWTLARSCSTYAQKFC